VVLATSDPICNVTQAAQEILAICEFSQPLGISPTWVTAGGLISPSENGGLWSGCPEAGLNGCVFCHVIRGL